MICAVDIETSGLNAQKYILGCVITERNKSPQIFNSPNKMWNYIKELGKKEAKRDKSLFVYGHNHEYDFYGYAQLEDSNIKYYSLNPFIAQYENIYFLDSFAIYRMSLKEVGNIIGHSKFETPIELLSDSKNIDYEKVSRYLIRDTEIVLFAILQIKAKLNDEKMKPRKLMTIGQISMNYFMNRMRKEKMNHIINMIWKEDKKNDRYFPSWEIHKPRNIGLLEKAYRGGRVEAFQVGTFKDTAMLDFNSLYPFSAISIEVPDLRKEILIREPLKRYSKDFILNNIGVSKCLLEKPAEVGQLLGLIGVRFKDEQVFPSHNCLIVGTFTHLEIKEALRCGYKLIDIEVSVIYKKAINPFIDMMNELYKLRLNNKFDNFFYKNMMNQFLGKLAQKKANFEICVDDVNKREQYLQKNYKIKDATGTNYVYEKREEKKPSKWYAVIIPSYINAYARIELYKLLRKINRNDLLYSDTDSILFKNSKKYKKLISNTGNKLGQVKCIGYNKNAIIYTKKSYCFDNLIRLSGVSKIFLDMKNFRNGIIKYKRMQSIKEGVANAGRFYDDVTDLNESKEKKIDKDIEIKNTKLFIDQYEDNINYFVNKMRKTETFIKNKNNILV